MLSGIEMDLTLLVGSEYIELKYLKNLYLAVLQGNEAEFNEEIIRRIKTLRRNPPSHTVVIDFPLTAIVKIAGKNGLRCHVEAAELPAFLLNETYVLREENPKLPLSEEAFEQFGIRPPW